MINLKECKKEVFIALNINDPQFNLQNDLSQSQLLLATTHPTLVIIFEYVKLPDAAALQTSLT